MAPPVIDSHTDRGGRGFVFEEGNAPSYREHGSSTDDPYQDQHL